MNLLVRLLSVAVLLALLSGSVVPPPPAPTPIAARLPDVTGANVAAHAAGTAAGSVAVPGSDSGLPIAAPSGGIGSVLIAEAVHGTWAYANPSHGSDYLAIPEGPGWIVWVCGPLDCFERVSTDAGPELWLQRVGRIGDLSSVDFLRACGPLGLGLCRGSYAILGAADQSGDDPAPHPDDQRMRAEDLADRPLPATSTEGSTP